MSLSFLTNTPFYLEFGLSKIQQQTDVKPCFSEVIRAFGHVDFIMIFSVISSYFIIHPCPLVFICSYISYTGLCNRYPSSDD